jgi:tetratricopeptide (TPR) repeat protein
MHSSRRESGLRRLKIFIWGGVFLGGIFIFLTLTNDAFNRRLESIPYYTRAYINQFRPNVAMPAAPEQSAIAPELLLDANPESANNTSAYFDDENLAPAPSNQNSDTVKVVQSSVLTPDPIAPQVNLTGASHQWQTWNNCGPSTITMNLSYYDRRETQADAALFLKPNEDDKNVSPAELAAYAQSLGFEATARINGDIALIKQLLSNGFPVIVEFWADPEDNGGLGHYRLFTGYNEAGGYFLAEDSLNGSGIQVPIAEFDPAWQVFHRTYIVVFPPDRTALMHAIVGQDMIDSVMLERALLTAQTEARNNPTNSFAWFNLGTSYAHLGQPEQAASAFDEARRLGLPYRMLWYQFELFDAYLAAGRYQDVIELTTATLEATGGLEELYYYRGIAKQALGQNNSAAEDFRAALEYNPNFDLAANALTILEINP